MNLAENLERSAHYFPERAAIIQDSRKIAFLEFNEESSRVATALIGLEVRKGEHVAFCAPNSYEWLAFYYGVLKAGTVAVTLPSTLTKSELYALIGEPRLTFMIQEFARKEA